MAIITINLEEVGPEFVDGIPLQVKLSTNVPSVIYYTLDGAEPQVGSQIYINPISLPTDQSSVNLRAFAISGADTGALNILFSPNNSNLYFPRRDAYGSLGIAVDAYGRNIVVYDGYGLNDNSVSNVIVRHSNYYLEDLDIKYSRTDEQGVPPGVMIMMGPEPSEYWQDNAVNEKPTDVSTVFFNPRSLYIVIDGRDGYDAEVVYPINRPMMSTVDPVKYLNGRQFFDQRPFISGGLVKSIYNYKTGTVVFYYFDTVECRWIKSIQKFDNTKLPDNIAERKQRGPCLVIPWIYNKRTSVF